MGERIDEVFNDYVRWLLRQEDGDGELGISGAELSVWATKRLNSFKDFVDVKIEVYREDAAEGIEGEYNWDALQTECRENYENVQQEAGYTAEEMEAEAEHCSNPPCSAFIGTAFALAPSGKYYTPWANSNVDFGEAMLDAIWYDSMDEVLEKHEMYLCSGEGDPCDLFMTMEYKKEEIAE